MNNYTRFRQYFSMIREDFLKNGLSNIDIHDIQDKRDFYKKIGITDDEKIKQLEHKKSSETNDRLELGISLVEQYGSVYEIEEDVMRYISMNKIPPKDIVKKLKLPFNTIFIETEFSKEDFPELNVNKIGGMLITETSVLSRVESELKQDTLDYKNLGRAFVVHYFCEENQRYWIDEFKINIDELKELKIHYDSPGTAKFIKRFLMNFILFINDPEVELVYHKRDKKNVERRLRQGKPVLPDSRKVKIIGRLKKYVDGVRSHLQGNKFSFRFWVSGHYRTLTSERYVHMKDKIIRVEPYLKGQGILLKRTYDLSFEKNDDRKVDELTLDGVN